MGLAAQVNAAANAVFKNIWAFADRLCMDPDSHISKIEKAKPSHGNMPYVCPACGNTKGKFAVKEDGTFHCFVCEKRGQSNGSGMVSLAASAYFKSVSETAREDAARRLLQWPEIAAEVQRWREEHKSTAQKPSAPKKRSPAEVRRIVYQRALNPKSRKGIAYAESRGIRAETLSWKRVAFFDGSELYGFSEEELLEAGLKRKNASGRGTHYVMRDRIGVPTSEEYTLYGRHINPEWSQPHNYCGKVSEAFGTKEALEIKARGGVKRLYVVESLLDFLSIEQNVGDAREPQCCTITTFGTRGIDGDNLVVLVKRIAPQEVIIVPDHDEWFKDGKRHAPGQAAALRRADLLEMAGINVRLAILPRGMDPNDITSKLKWDVETFRREMDKAVSPLMYRLWYEAHWFMTGEATNGGAQTAFVQAATQIVREHYQTGEIPSVVARFVAKLARLPVDDASIEEVRLVMMDILKSRK